MTKAKNKKKTFLWLGVLLIAAVLIGVGIKYETGMRHEITYKLTKVRRSDVKMTILSTGAVSAENRLDLMPAVAGRIEKVLVQEGQVVKKGQVLAWMSSTERATLIDTALSKGPEEAKYWEDSYKMTPILAPGDGLIILKNSDTGQTVTQTSIVLSMSDRLIVKANVDETDLAAVKLRQPVDLVLDAFPENVLPAKVLHIGYDAKTVNNVTTYEVDVIADHTPRFMKSGMTANVTFLIDEHDDVLTVPAASIKRERKKTFVLLPNPDPKGEPIQTEVQMGLSDGKKVEIISGLKEDQPILTAAVRTFARKDDKPNSSPLSSSYGGGGRPH